MAGVPVNQSVPHGADADAAALSRPNGQPTQTVENHTTHARLSLLSGETADAAPTASTSRPTAAIQELLASDDAAALHRAWLTSDVASELNESVYHPYTSLKYHTLLVAALLDNYHAGHTFADLRLVVDPAETLVAHRTIYADEHFALRIDHAVDDRPATRLGRRPWRSWATTWARLPAHPLDTDDDKHEMVLDANLRRIAAWSTALQYLEEFREAVDR